MKNKEKIRNVVLTAMLLIFSVSVLKADWVIDNAYNFKINVPASWSTNSYSEGSDQVHEFTNPDENIFIQIRCFDNGGMDATSLAALFEEGLVAEGASALGQSNEGLNGLQGVMGIYTTNYEGTEMGIITFTAVNDNIGYLMFVIVPLDQFEQRADEADGVLNTFTLLSGSSSYNEPKKEDQPSSSGLGGITGSTGSQSSGGQNYVTISGGSINGTFNFSESGSYPIKNQQTVVIRGLDNSGTNALEIYLYNHKGSGTFTYGAASDGNRHFVVGAVDGRAASSNVYSGSGECTITEYREGGMIKGYFTAYLGGHDIEGSFSLPLSSPKMPGGF